LRSVVISICVGPGLGDDVGGVVRVGVSAWDGCAGSDLGWVQFVSVGLVGGLGE
jgi:hypothetical protein